MIDLTAYMTDALKRNITRNYGVPMPSNAPTLRFADIFQQALNEPTPKKSTNPLLARIEELENRIKQLNELLNEKKEEPEEENELPEAEFSEEKKKEPSVAKKTIKPQPTEFQPDRDVLANISEKYFGVNPYSGKETKKEAKPSGVVATIISMRSKGMSDDDIRAALIKQYVKKGLDRSVAEAIVEAVMRSAPSVG